MKAAQRLAIENRKKNVAPRFDWRLGARNHTPERVLTICTNKKNTDTHEPMSAQPHAVDYVVTDKGIVADRICELCGHHKDIKE